MTACVPRKVRVACCTSPFPKPTANRNCDLPAPASCSALFCWVARCTYSRESFAHFPSAQDIPHLPLLLTTTTSLHPRKSSPWHRPPTVRDGRHLPATESVELLVAPSVTFLSSFPFTPAHLRARLAKPCRDEAALWVPTETSPRTFRPPTLVSRERGMLAHVRPQSDAIYAWDSLCN